MASHLIIVEWLDAPVPADSKRELASVTACCSAVCVAGWAKARDIEPARVNTKILEARPRRRCAFCAYCGDRLHDVKDGYCLTHGEDGCPNAHFLSSTTATLFARKYVALTRRIPISDKAWDAAERCWAFGNIDGGFVAALVFNELKKA